MHTVYRRNGNITASSLNAERYSILAENQIIDKQSIVNNGNIILSFKHILNDDFYTETIAKEDSIPRYWNDKSLNILAVKWHNSKSLRTNKAIIGSPLSPDYSLNKENSKYPLEEIFNL